MRLEFHINLVFFYLARDRVVWMNGPFRAGKNDAKIFRNHGLMARLKLDNKKTIGDNGYGG
jgi:hypothetical protein